MKIAINTLPLYKTKVGMGKYIVELVNRVPKGDMGNEYLIYVSGKNKKYFDLSSDNIVVRQVPDSLTVPFLKILWEQFVLPFSLWRNKVDIYHATGFVLPLWRLKETKYVVTVADMTFFTHPQYHTWFKRIYFKLLMPSSIKKAEKVLAISENTKNDIIAVTKVGPEKIITMYLAADHSFVPVTKKEYEPVLEKYNIRHPYILFVGMLEPRKNINCLIKAFSMLKEKKRHKLVIAGKKGWLFESIFTIVEQLRLKDNIIFIGYVPDADLPGLYSAATCFVYPSFYEGFGLPILEAMACGCPVITSNNSSMKEIAGTAAILIDPYSVMSIRDAIQVVISNKKIQLEKRKQGLEQEKKFNWEKMALDTKSIYASLRNL